LGAADQRIEEHYSSAARLTDHVFGLYPTISRQDNPDCGIFCWAAEPIVVFGSNAHEMSKLIERRRR
jgi:hypothetical protein